MIRWTKPLGAGLLAGLVAALFMTLVMALLRLFLGVPLPAELGGDRFLPTFSVAEFLELLGRFGGPIQAKKIALLSGWGGQLAVGVLVGLVYALIAEWERSRDPERSFRFGVGRRGAFFVAVSVAVIWVATLAALWPVLGANNRGLTPGPASVTTALGLLASYAAYGVALVLTYRLITSREPLRQSAPVGRPIGRRAFLAGGAGAILALASGGLVRHLYTGSTLPYDGMKYMGADLEAITPNDRFYVVTKNLIDPSPTKAAWRLRVDGMVESPRTYGFEEIAALPAVEQEMTLECISNSVGGGLMSNAVWKGTPLRNLIEEAGPRPGAVDVLLHAADGYTHDVGFEKAMEETTLVAYEMNGVPLPQRHGYPARILVPGYFGEGSVKWVTRVELFDRQVEDEYYGKQGWEAEFVPTTSRLDLDRFAPGLPARAGENLTLKGVAFAGDRGVSRVEVSTDGGGSWEEANIEYAPSRLAWALWSYYWSPEEPGEYRLTVRATDGDGEPQTAEARRVALGRGATGYHSVTARVEA